MKEEPRTVPMLGWFREDVSLYQVTLTRGHRRLEELIRADYQGIVVSDRCSSYNGLQVEQRQVCWAHLKRDFARMPEHCGVSA